jgi:hypothetical protein
VAKPWCNTRNGYRITDYFCGTSLQFKSRTIPGRSLASAGFEKTLAQRGLHQGWVVSSRAHGGANKLDCRVIRYSSLITLAAAEYLFTGQCRLCHDFMHLSYL